MRNAYNNAMNEGGEGYNPYAIDADQRAIYVAADARLQAEQDAWTPETTAARIAQWAQARAEHPMDSSDEIGERLGYGMGALGRYAYKFGIDF
jgi:hypothetical protein